MMNPNNNDVEKINFQIEEDLYTEFKSLCEENFDTPSAVMRAVVHDFIEYVRLQEGDRW